MCDQRLRAKLFASMTVNIRGRVDVPSELVPKHSEMEVSVCRSQVSKQDCNQMLQQQSL